MANALALLKSQEPRLITAGDFTDNPDMDSNGFLPTWIEYRRDGKWCEYWEGTDDGWTCVNSYNWTGLGYRCWTAKPTYEQRRATQWDT